MKVEGDYRRLRLLHDQLEPLFELAELPVVAYVPFGKESHHLTVVEALTHPFERIFSAEPAYGDDVEPFEKPLEVPLLVDPPVHDEFQRPRRCHLKQEPVYPAYVVPKQQRPAALGDVLHALHKETVAYAKKRQEHQPRRKLGHLCRRVDGGAEADPCGDMEDSER